MQRDLLQFSLSKRQHELRNLISSEEYESFGRYTTVCVIRTRDGVEIVGSAKRENNDYGKGRQLALIDALTKLDELIN